MLFLDLLWITLAAAEGPENLYPLWINALATFGVGGAVLSWMMFKLVPAILDLASAIDRNNRSVLVLAMTNANVLDQHEHHVELISSLQKEVELATTLREKKPK